MPTVQCPGWSPSKVLTEHVSPKLEPDGRAGQVELSNFDINIHRYENNVINITINYGSLVFNKDP